MLSILFCLLKSNRPLSKTNFFVDEKESTENFVIGLNKMISLEGFSEMLKENKLRLVKISDWKREPMFDKDNLEWQKTIKNELSYHTEKSIKNSEIFAIEVKTDSKALKTNNI